MRRAGGRRGSVRTEATGNLFGRLARVTKSYVNALISSAEDPEKMLDQTVTEMNEDLIKLRQATAQVMASQKQLENKAKQAQTQADDWGRRAQLALSKGDEELAREALKRKKSFQDNADSLGAQLSTQKESVNSLMSNTRLLESKISEAKAKKDALKARAQSAKTATKVNDMVSGLGTSNALAAFEKMEEKVMQMEAAADASNMIAGDELAAQFQLLESDGGIDDELAAMKRQLSGDKKPAGALPPGKTKPMSEMSDAELAIEAELEALRKKAEDA